MSTRAVSICEAWGGIVDLSWRSPSSRGRRHAARAATDGLILETRLEGQDDVDGSDEDEGEEDGDLGWEDDDA